MKKSTPLSPQGTSSPCIFFSKDMIFANHLRTFGGCSPYYFGAPGALGTLRRGQQPCFFLYFFPCFFERSVETYSKCSSSTHVQPCVAPLAQRRPRMTSIPDTPWIQLQHWHGTHGLHFMQCSAMPYQNTSATQVQTQAHTYLIAIKRRQKLAEYITQWNHAVHASTRIHDV